MKTLFSILFSILCLASKAENIEIIIYENLNTPLVGAEIFSTDKSYIGKTNHLGVCIIKSSIATQFDSLHIFKIGYLKTSLSTQNLKTSSKIMLTKCNLKKENLSIDSIQSLVKKSISKIHENYTSFKAEEIGHFEQQVFANENLVYQVESDLQIEKSSYANDNEKDVLKYLSKKETFNPEDLNAGYFAKEKTQNFIYHYEDIVKSIGSHISENVDETDVYNYILNGKFELNGNTIYEVSFTPASENKGMYSGVCHIDSSNQAIIHLEYDITENGLKHFNHKNPFIKIYQFITGEKEDLNRFHYNVSYKKDVDNKFTLDQITANIEMLEFNRKDKTETILTSDCILDINKSMRNTQKIVLND